jgi:hypothetical protein
VLLQPGEDPFTLLRQEKKERQKKQNKQQLANVKQALKTGGAAAVPATLRLAATLPDKGKGKPTKRRELRDEVRRHQQQQQHHQQQKLLTSDSMVHAAAVHCISSLASAVAG